MKVLSMSLLGTQILLPEGREPEPIKESELPNVQTPQDLKLPKKFQVWRDGQWEAIEKIAKSEAKVYLLDSPPGTGKSVIGIGAYQLWCWEKQKMAILDRMKGGDPVKLSPHCIFVTRTKQLQAQLLSEFPRARTVYGRNNFPCLNHENLFPEITAEDCTHTEDKPCEKRDFCPYRVEKMKALGAPIAVLNTSYFLHEANGPGMFSNSDMLIIDEVDTLEDQLMSYIEFRVTEKQLKRLGLSKPRDTSSPDEWFHWAQVINIEGKIDNLGSQLSMDKEWSDVEIKLQKREVQLRAFQQKLNLFARDVDKTWVFSEEKSDEDTAWIFKPVLVAPYCDRYIWRHTNKALGMSGTIFDAKTTAENIGLEDCVGKATLLTAIAEVKLKIIGWQHHKLDSPFPVENRLIYYDPVVNLTQKTMEDELPRLLDAVIKIIEQRPCEKVLVHATNYNIANYLFLNLSEHFPKRIISHTRGDRSDMLEVFKASPEPLVMVSPSFDRGVDLEGNLCRCIIICKMPYIGLGDPQVKKRMEMAGGRRWYLLKAAQTLVQMTGRGVRSNTDYCTCYILDRQFDRLMGQVGFLIPQWWKNAIRRFEL